MRPYANRLNDILRNVSSGAEPEFVGSFGQERVVNKAMIIVVTSDRGLCGPFNGNIFKEVSRHIKSKYRDLSEKRNLTILPIGKKAYDFFRKRDYVVDPKFYALLGSLDFEHAREVAEYVMASFDEAEFDRVEIVYNEFKNVAQQLLKVERYLPIPQIEAEGNRSSVDIDYIFEPTKEFLIKEIVPKSLRIQLYKALLESNAAEQGARMTAMDQATENADELLKDLRLTYNRTRQAAITKEILEIVGGAEALNAS